MSSMWSRGRCCSTRSWRSETTVMQSSWSARRPSIARPGRPISSWRPTPPTGTSRWTPTGPAEIPPLEQALTGAGFVPESRDAVDVWLRRRDTPSMASVQVQVDLLVPEAVSPGKGRRAARLRGHGPTAARSVRGLEGALVDQDLLLLGSLDKEDSRKVVARVAGPPRCWSRSSIRSRSEGAQRGRATRTRSMYCASCAASLRQTWPSA